MPISPLNVSWRDFFSCLSTTLSASPGKHTRHTHPAHACATTTKAVTVKDESAIKLAELQKETERNISSFFRDEANKSVQATLRLSQGARVAENMNRPGQRLAVGEGRVQVFLLSLDPASCWRPFLAFFPNAKRRKLYSTPKIDPPKWIPRTPLPPPTLGVGVPP